MPFAKLLGVVLLALVALLCGSWLCRFERMRCKQAQALFEMMQYVRAQIDCFSLSLPKILKQTDAQLLRDCGASRAPASFEELLLQCEPLPTDKMRALLFDFAAALGKDYRTEQLRLCNYYIERFSALCEELRRELDRRLKLMRLLPCTLGAALILLLI